MSWFRKWASCLLIAMGIGVPLLPAQVLTLAEARTRATRASPELLAALEAATARERQASAFPNSVLTYAREQTSGAGPRLPDSRSARRSSFLT